MNGTDISTEGTLDPVLRDRIEFEFDEVMHAFDAALDERARPRAKNSAQPLTS